jgi:hypothetical protein
MPGDGGAWHGLPNADLVMEDTDMSKQVRKLRPHKLSLGERAVVTEMDTSGLDLFGSQHHCAIVDLSPNQLKIVTPDLIPAGQYLEIAVNLAGASDGCVLSGVVRTVMQCCGGRKWLLDVDVVKDELANPWRYQFN